MGTVVTLGSFPLFQWLHSISDQGLHKITIWGLVLGVIGGLYLTYELLDRRHGPLRWTLRIVTPMIVTIAATALLFIPVFVLLSLDAGNIGIIIAIVIATLPGMIGAFHGAFASSLDATSKSKSLNIGQLRVSDPSTTVISPNDHVESLNAEAQSTLNASRYEAPFHPKSKAGPFSRLKLRERWQKFRKGLPNASIGFIRGFLYTFGYWLIALTFIFGTQLFVDVITISLIFALPLGGIAGFCWLGYIHPPAQSSSGFWEFVQRSGASIASFFANITYKPFGRFKEWATNEPTTIAVPQQKPKTAEDTGEQQRLIETPLRPAFFSLRDSKIGFWLWLGVSLLFSTTLCIFILVTNSLLSQPVVPLPHTQELMAISNTKNFVWFLVTIFGSTIVLALVAGWFAGGITRITYWWTSFSPGRVLGACGVLLALIGFGVQLVLPVAQISDVTTTVYIYHGHSDLVTSVAWSPDGKNIASGS